MENEKIHALGLPVRTYNALSIALRSKNKELTIKELISMPFDDLVKIRNLGDKGIKEIIDKVHSFDLMFDFEKLLNQETGYQLMFELNELELEKIEKIITKEQEVINLLKNKVISLKENNNYNILNEEKISIKPYIELLCLSARANNALTKIGKIQTFDELISKTPKEIIKIRNLGNDSFKDILNSIHILGYKLEGEEITSEKLDITNKYFSVIISLDEEYRKYNDLINKYEELKLKKRIINKMICLEENNKKVY